MCSKCQYLSVEKSYDIIIIRPLKRLFHVITQIFLVFMIFESFLQHISYAWSMLSFPVLVKEQ